MRNIKLLLIVAIVMVLHSCQKDDTLTKNLTADGIEQAKKPTGGSPKIKYGKLKDIDKNEYKTVKIGNQEWMAENLRVTRFRNGDPIANVTDGSQWSSLTNSAWCIYDNDILKDPIYGKIYNWYAIIDPRGLAPKGWHIPSEAEWTTLKNFLGDDAGGKMKSKFLWASPNTGATNSSGFNAVPGGVRAPWGGFINLGSYGYWWGSTEVVPDTYYFNTTLNYDNALLYTGVAEKFVGISVRCIKN